jgi:hypothetical protein
MLYRSTDRLCRCGAPVQYLSHSASFHSLEKYAPPNAGTKQLNDLLDSYAEKIVREAKLEDIDIGTMKTDERPRVSRFMDRVENEVFENLAEEVRKLRAKVQELEAKA